MGREDHSLPVYEKAADPIVLAPPPEDPNEAVILYLLARFRGEGEKRDGEIIPIDYPDEKGGGKSPLFF